ncbi:uncharacterized protein TRIADDRAFT_61133 [Trichoplax adhaerens]|uniref:5'-deoxynucleotidase HDDC2 n=1 Tax=Trichoplax adhaerens TaxID=10228 RepID=B3SA48_TRIAD|nr:hypothetical protein TRIADDRAFT_61133 [Trichoplax adhaerens]EDV20370.1 hypothetical protein TRIADDRAFT_61133 [Trichoplax adhaerens]|eukprot:XP_002117064.1 hypothetical protein TRIADDRAFT_61133 [Trichoplax adhaerens]
MAEIEGIFKFMKICGQLKKVKRTGWVNHQVTAPESVAGHMYRMAMMTFLLDDPEISLDKTRCMKVAIVHDLAESIVGDITPFDGVTKEDKHRMEKEAMQSIKALVSNEEYETQATAEARAVKDLDRFEMILQAFEYEEDENRFGDLEDFFKSTEGKFKHPAVKRWDSYLRNKRREKLK